jgi:hypothetical protein
MRIGEAKQDYMAHELFNLALLERVASQWVVKW